MTDAYAQKTSFFEPEKTQNRLGSLLEVIDVEKVEHLKDHPVYALVWDSRQVVPGSIFFAIKGEITDGNRYIPDAISRGAVAIISEQAFVNPSKVTRIQVKDVRESLARLSKEFYGRVDERLNLVGITGTNGKTTVSYLLRHILEYTKRKCGLISTVEYLVGDRKLPSQRTTPESDEVCALLSEMTDVGCTEAVMEVSSHGIDQKRVLGLNYHTAAFLNLTKDHLDYHGTMDAYLEAKASFVTQRANNRVENVVLNIDDPYVESIVGDINKDQEVFLFGLSKKADYRATEIKLSNDGIAYTLVTPGGKYKVKSSLIGEFSVSNTLAAITCALTLGVDAEDAVEAVSRFKAVPGRMEEVNLGQNFKAFVDYAHTPDAIDKLLSTIQPLTKERLIVVFGCGGDRDKKKRPLMTENACKWADHIIATSDNPRTEDQTQIFEDMIPGVDGKTRISFEIDRNIAIQTAVKLAQPGDCVVIAGKGHEAYQEIRNTMTPFNDREVLGSHIKAKMEGVI